MKERGGFATNFSYVLCRWFVEVMAAMGGSGGFETSQASMLHLIWTQRVAPQRELPEVSGSPSLVTPMLSLMLARLEILLMECFHAIPFPHTPQDGIVGRSCAGAYAKSWEGFLGAL
jgi:hypothetical protein